MSHSIRGPIGGEWVHRAPASSPLPRTERSVGCVAHHDSPSGRFLCNKPNLMKIAAAGRNGNLVNVSRWTRCSIWMDVITEWLLSLYGLWSSWDQRIRWTIALRSKHENGREDCRRSMQCVDTGFYCLGANLACFTSNAQIIVRIRLLCSLVWGVFSESVISCSWRELRDIGSVSQNREWNGMDLLPIAPCASTFKHHPLMADDI